jgi:hypothetical protein
VFDENHRPSPTEPLVYHLHGFDQVPPSLVLSEDDYLEFLVAIPRDKGRNIDIIPLHEGWTSPDWLRVEKMEEAKKRNQSIDWLR